MVPELTLVGAKSGEKESNKSKNGVEHKSTGEWEQIKLKNSVMGGNCEPAGCESGNQSKSGEHYVDIAKILWSENLNFLKLAGTGWN